MLQYQDIITMYFFLNQFPISFNVSGMRRLGQDIGLCEANVPCPKCGGDKTAQRAKPDCGFSEPVAAQILRRNAYRLLGEVISFLQTIHIPIKSLANYSICLKKDKNCSDYPATGSVVRILYAQDLNSLFRPHIQWGQLN